MPVVDQALLDQVARNAAAIKRIGQESREHQVHISDLDKRIAVGERWRESLDGSIVRLTAATEKLSCTLEEHLSHFNEHLIKDAKDEGKLTRQAIWLWASLVGGGTGWVLLLASGALQQWLLGSLP
jgi:hypothetical protein